MKSCLCSDQISDLKEQLKRENDLFLDMRDKAIAYKTALETIILLHAQGLEYGALTIAKEVLEKYP